MKLTAAATIATMIGGLSPVVSASTSVGDGEAKNDGDIFNAPKAFVYSELQISAPFSEVRWEEVNETLRKQPGLLNKTWLAGVGNNSLGGIYAFDSIENAQRFVTGYFPREARNSGVAQTTRVFDATVVMDASRDMGSPHFGISLNQTPVSFVYTEVQVNVPFDKAPWRKRNSVLRKQPGLLEKTWLSGLHTNTLGGIDAFDTVENSRRFALDDFPQTAKRLNAAFYTRVFDAGVAEEASRQLRSPYFS